MERVNRSERHKQIGAMLATGLKRTDIAHHLSLSTHAINFYVLEMLKLWDAKNSNELVANMIWAGDIPKPNDK